jgi:hypothetical protein
MLGRVTLALALAMFLPIVGAAPQPKGEEKPVLHLPNTVGDERVLELSAKGKTYEVRERVMAVEHKDGRTVVSVAREEGGRPVEYQYAVSPDGVCRLRAGEVVDDPPHRLLKLPAREGEAWEWEPRSGPAMKYKYTTGKVEEVETPAGMFKAVRVEVEVEDGGAVLRKTYWHAPEVGMIKVVVHDKKADWVQVLKSFTPGRKR